jgi:hypothetical protein
LDERQLIQIQMAALRSQLGRLEEALQGNEIKTDLLDRVGVRLGKLVKDRRARLNLLDKQVQGGGPLGERWIELREISDECEPLFNESLAFIAGLLSRSAGIDGGLCRLADALLLELSDRADVPWDRFTILGEGEFWGSMADIIQLGFPQVSIWSLPIAVHEYAHFLGRRLESEGADGSPIKPVQVLREEASARGLEEGGTPEEALELAQRYSAHVEEEFADVAATYAIGPSYLCACVLLRFNPRRAYEDGSRHPAPARRVHAMTATLDRMDRAQGGVFHPYRDVTDYLRDTWQRALAAAGEPKELPADDADAVSRRTADLYEILDAETPALAYRVGAQALIDRLRPHAAGDREPDDDDKIADVVNAAWMARIDDIERGLSSADRLRDIGDAAFLMCEQIANRKA